MFLVFLWWKKPTRKELLAEVDRLKSLGEIYGPVDELTHKQKELETQIQDLREQYSEKKKIFENLRRLVDRLDSALEWEDIGIYEPVFSFESSEKFKVAIKKNRDAQKAMISSKTAAYCDTGWTVNGSRREGEKMMNQAKRLVLRAFNNECTAIISKVTWKNFEASKKKIDRAHQQIEKLNSSNQVNLNNEYVSLKHEELALTHELHKIIQEEKEEARRLRDLERENQRGEKEIEAALKKADNEEAQYQEALAQARAELGLEDSDALKQKISDLEEKLAHTESERQRAQSMAEITRSGYVYVISNIGSFGDRVFKIGMTRRIDPMDRVKELGDASVPFTFDVHALIWTTDAPNLERELHKRFDRSRVNRVNYRKEFFEADMSEVKSVLQELNPGCAFSEDMEAEHYRMSLQLSGEKRNEAFPASI